MEQLKGLYFFSMSAGTYADYRVNGFYACDHPVSEDEWIAFARDQAAVRIKKQSELVTARFPSAEYHAQREAYRAWEKDHGDSAVAFARKHNMVRLDDIELFDDLKDQPY